MQKVFWGHLPHQFGIWKCCFCSHLFFLLFFQLLQEQKHITGSHSSASEASQEAVNQSFEILLEKEKQKIEANLHPFAITQPVAFSEEMLSKFDWSPTVRSCLQAFKLVKEDFEILRKSYFTNERGISLMARGFLTENSILQAFPEKHFLLKRIFQFCEKNLQNNPNYFEGLVLSYALQHFAGKISLEGSKVDA